MQTDIRTSRERCLAELPAATWRDLAAGPSLFQSAEWLRAVEADPRSCVSYSVASMDGSVAGVLPVYRPTGRADSLYQPELHFPELVPTVPPEAARVGVLLGGRAGYRTELLLAHHQSGNEVLSALVRDALGGPDADPYGFLLFATVSVLESVTSSGLPVMWQLAFAADANLPVTGATVADYLASLPSRRRTKVRREMRVFKEAGLRVDTVCDVSDLESATPQLADMLCQLQRKHGLEVSAEEMTSEFARQWTYLGRRAVTFVCRADGDILGFATGYLGDDRWLYIRMGGFDYGKLRSAYEYFNTAIYGPLIFCAENGYAGLRLGAGSHAAKAFRGAILSPLAHIAMPGAWAGDSPPNHGGRKRAVQWWRREIQRMPDAFDPREWERWTSS